MRRQVLSCLYRAAATAGMSRSGTCDAAQATVLGSLTHCVGSGALCQRLEAPAAFPPNITQRSNSGVASALPWVERLTSQYSTSTSAQPLPQHETHNDTASYGVRLSKSKSQGQTCWSCHHHHARGALICKSCGKLQPVDPRMTYFDLLGM